MKKIWLGVVSLVLVMGIRTVGDRYCSNLPRGMAQIIASLNKKGSQAIHVG